MDTINLQTSIDLYQARIHLQACIWMLLLLLLLRSMRFQKDLNLLTKTLWESSGDLAHFLCMCAFCILCFSFTANVVFGPYQEQFRSAEQSFLTVMDASFNGHLVLPQMNPTATEELGGVDGKLGALFLGLFYGSFVLLASFVLLQFLIAIVCDVMGDVRAQNGDTLRQDVHMLYRHFVGESLRSWPRPTMLSRLQQAMELRGNDEVPAAQTLPATAFGTDLPPDAEAESATRAAKMWDISQTQNILEGFLNEEGLNNVLRILNPRREETAQCGLLSHLFAAAWTRRRRTRPQNGTVQHPLWWAECTDPLLLQPLSELLQRFFQGDGRLSNCKIYDLKCHQKLVEQLRRRPRQMLELKRKLGYMTAQHQALARAMATREQQRVEIIAAMALIPSLRSSALKKGPD